MRVWNSKQEALQNLCQLGFAFWIKRRLYNSQRYFFETISLKIGFYCKQGELLGIQLGFDFGRDHPPPIDHGAEYCVRTLFIKDSRYLSMKKTIKGTQITVCSLR